MLYFPSTNKTELGINWNGSTRNRNRRLVEQIDPTLVFGIPMVATRKRKQTYQNLQVNPDIPVALKYEDYLNGQDKLERAVEEMLKPLNKM
jgi:hypothetical protein